MFGHRVPSSAGCSITYCAQLVSEQEVQAMSIDAATANVEVHYAYICDAYGAFMARYQQQAAAHAGVEGWACGVHACCGPPHLLAGFAGGCVRSYIGKQACRAIV